MNPRPTVVVIIAFYNGSPWIERSLRSVYAQTVPADEVIVVNDGSREEERAALAVLAGKYPFRIVDKANGGQGSARNAGVAASRCDLISFLDQDDFYLETHIETLLRLFPGEDRRLGFVYGDLCEADGDGNIVNSNMLGHYPGRHPKRGHVSTLLLHDMFVLPSASLIRRTAFEAVGGFDEQFTGYEDDDLFLRIFRAGYTNEYVDKPVTVWCIRGGSTSYSILMSRSRFRYFRKLQEMFPDNPGRHLHYLRDYLVPRFGPFFEREAIEAAKTGSPHRAELNAILEEYKEIVAKNEKMPAKYRRRLRQLVFLTRAVPPAPFRLLSRLSRIPILKKLVIRI